MRPNRVGGLAPKGLRSKSKLSIQTATMAEKLTLEGVPANVRELYERGNAALEKKNFDYAIAIYGQVLVHQPGFYPCREALRAAQFKKAGEKTGFFRKFVGSASNSPQLAKAQILLRSSPQEALSAAEGVLNTDPNNTTAHKILAEAASALGYLKTAVLSLEIAFRNSSRDPEIAMRLAEALATAGDVARAESILEDVLRQNPADADVSQTLKNISARRTLKEGGYDKLSDGTGSYRDILKDKEEAVSLEQASREVRDANTVTRMIKEHKARLTSEPGSPRLLRALADLHLQNNDFDESIAYYEQVIANSDINDAMVDKELTRAKTKRIDHQIATLDTSHPDYINQFEALRAERVATQINDAKRRVEEHPNDLTLRFDLGQTFLEEGKIAEAIQEFQKSQNNPHLKTRSLFNLGQCFARRRMFDMAARSYQNALKEKLIFDEEKKELVYSLAHLLEQMGKRDEAIEQYKQIYEIDIGYKDVAQKVDEYYSA